MFKILITYDTGNSFGTEEGLESYLDGEWKILETATENLNRIREHYEYYKAVKNYHFSKREKDEAKKIIELAPKQRWYADNVEELIYSLKLVTDVGVEYQCSAFWCGYFEHLVSAEIEMPKFTF